MHSFKKISCEPVIMICDEMMLEKPSLIFDLCIWICTQMRLVNLHCFNIEAKCAWFCQAEYLWNRLFTIILLNKMNILSCDQKEITAYQWKFFCVECSLSALLFYILGGLTILCSRFLFLLNWFSPLPRIMKINQSIHII